MKINQWNILLVILLFLLSACQHTRQTKPNFIFILADDLGYGELGCYGQELIQTPNIDRLASEGMRFTQFYSGSPVCAPSRCVLLTGLHTCRSIFLYPSTRFINSCPHRPVHTHWQAGEGSFL